MSVVTLDSLVEHPKLQLVSVAHWHSARWAWNG